MSKNLLINGSIYNGVESISIPDDGGANAVFLDTSGATATPETVLKGYTFGAGGEMQEGTLEQSGGVEITYERINDIDIVGLTVDTSSRKNLTLTVPLSATPKEIVSIGGYFTGWEPSDEAYQVTTGIAYPTNMLGVCAVAFYPQGPDSNPYMCNTKTVTVAISGNSVTLTYSARNTVYPTDLASIDLYIGYTV